MPTIFNADAAMSGIFRGYIIEDVPDATGARLYIPAVHRQLMPFKNPENPKDGILDVDDNGYVRIANFQVKLKDYPVAQCCSWMKRPKFEVGECVYVMFENASSRYPVMCGNVGSTVPIYTGNWGGGGGYTGAADGVEGYYDLGIKYQLSDSMIQTIATIIYGEDTAAGYGGWLNLASHMANLNEVHYGGGTDETSMQRTTRKHSDGGWYADNSFKRGTCDEAVKAARAVFLEGLRTLPRYVTEFDWFPGDAWNPQLQKNKSQYKRMETRIYQHGSGLSSNYLFWMFQHPDRTDGDDNVFGAVDAHYAKYKDDDNKFKRVSNTTSGGSTSGNKLVDTCKKYLNVPYVWGGTSPSGFDCSGLMQYVYKECGINIPRTSGDQAAGGTHISELSKCSPGDILCFGEGKKNCSHVGMCSSNENGKVSMIHAPHTGDVVKETNVSDSNYYTSRFMHASRY